MEGREGGGGEVDGEGSVVMGGKEQWFVEKQGIGNMEVCVFVCTHGAGQVKFHFQGHSGPPLC